MDKHRVLTSLGTPAFGDLAEALLTLPERYSYPARVCLWMGFLFASALLLRTQNHRPFGLPRLVVVFPLIVANALMPFLFHWNDDICTNVTCSLITVWFTTFKALGWALNRGPLVEPFDTLQFVAVYAFPITPTHIRGQEMKQQAAEGKKEDGGQEVYRHGGRVAESMGPVRESLRNFFYKIIGLACFTGVLATCKLPGLLESFLLGMALYCFLGMIMDGPATLASSAIGLTFAPHFDQPYITESVTAFWSKRWNLTAGNTLRFLIYDPINEGRLVYDPSIRVTRSPRRRMLGLMACFVVSGLCHQMMFLYFRHRLSAEFMALFLSQIPVMVVEQLGRKALKKRGKRVPRWIATPLAMYTVVACGEWFFFSDLKRSGVNDRTVGNIIASFQGMGAAVAGVLGALGRGWAAVDIAAPAGPRAPEL